MEQTPDHFNYAFSLFGLLLGFSLVEVLGGFARVLRTHEPSKIGWLTPALGFIVMLDLISFWAILWVARAVIPVETLSLFAGFLITGIYYLAASSIFPEQPATTDFREHYPKIRTRVVLAVLTCNLLTYGLLSLLFGRLPQATTLLVVGVFSVLFFALLVVKSHRSRIHGGLLAALVACYFVEAVWFYFR